MALSADRVITTFEQNGQKHMIKYKVAASTDIYAGAFVKVNGSGYLVPCDGSSGESCIGIALGQALNTGSNGDLSVTVSIGEVIEHAISGITIASVGEPIYTDDDETLTITSSNEQAGWIQAVPTGGTAIVKMLESAGQNIT